MSVVGFALEQPNSPRGHFTLNSAEFERDFIVLTDDYADGPITVCNAIGVPRPFQYYATNNELNLYAICREVTPERVEPNSLYWKVTAKYSTPEPRNRNDVGGGGAQRDAPGSNDNPLLMYPEVDTHFETYQAPVYAVFDTDGDYKPCMNSANEVFDPPPTKDRSRLVLTITRNEDLTSPALATSIAYMDKVNSDVFWGAAAGQVKVKSITCKRQTKQLPNGSQFYYLQVVYVFEFRETWDTYILDAGNYYFTSGESPKKFKFLTTDGHPCIGALDGAGHALASGGTPVFQHYRFYNRVPFAPLNLITSFTQAA